VFECCVLFGDARLHFSDSDPLQAKGGTGLLYPGLVEMPVELLLVSGFMKTVASSSPTKVR
jgi:hypothetical protein